MNRLTPLVAAAGIALVVGLAPGLARADLILQQPGERLPYFLDVEPHLALAYGDWTSGLGGGAGYGAGVRFSFVVAKDGFIPKLNNTVAIGGGLDFLHFDCAESVGAVDYGCSLNSLSFPVVLQWNFRLTHDWTVFGEPGFFIFHQFFSTSGNACGGEGCPSVSSTGALPAFFVGGSYSLNDRLALTARIGYPTINVGVSFLD